MSIEHPSGRVGDRFTKVVTLDEYRVYRGDRTSLKLRRLLKELSHLTEYGSRVASANWMLAGHQRHFTCGPRKARQAVDEEEYLFTVSREIGREFGGYM